MHSYSARVIGNPISATAWVLAGLSAFSGTVLYILTVGGSAGALANVLWGSIYGVGYLVLSPFFDPALGLGGLFYFVIGTFVWPLIVTIGVAVITDRLLSLFNRNSVIALLLASNLLVYPMNRAEGTFVYYLPIYGVFLGDF